MWRIILEEYGTDIEYIKGWERIDYTDVHLSKLNSVINQ